MPAASMRHECADVFDPAVRTVSSWSPSAPSGALPAGLRLPGAGVPGRGCAPPACSACSACKSTASAKSRDADPSRQPINLLQDSHTITPYSDTVLAKQNNH